MIKSLLTKFHIYLGLFFLVYLWLFSLTGLFLNHPQWGVNEYRTTSQWVESTATVSVAQGGNRFEQTEHYLEQLGLEGELFGMQERENQFRFSVRKAGDETQVTINPATGETKIRRKKADFYGIANSLHIFNGMKRFDPKKETLTWLATKLWVIAMDGLAVGLIIMILTGLYMWLQTKKIIGGAISLFLGTGIGIVFLLL